MSDNLEEVKPDVVPEQNVEAPAAPEHSAVEQRAMEMGWRPKEEFNGDEADFIDAKEFVRRAPLFEKIESQSKQIKQINRALESLKTHYTAKEEAAVRRALSELEEARTAAVTAGDGEAFTRVDKKIKQVEKDLEGVEAMKNEVPQEAPVHPAFVHWQNRNTWYGTTPYMRNYADTVGQELIARGGLSAEEVLKRIEDAVRKEFPNKFRNPNKDDAPVVSTGGSAPRGAGKSDAFESSMSPMEKKIMHDLVSTGQITKEEYIADLKKIKAR